MAPGDREFFIKEGQRLTDHANVDMIAEHVMGGGFGVVAIGHDQLSNGAVRVLKTFNPAGVSGDLALIRGLFIREALTWVGLWPHPNVVRAFALTLIDLPRYARQPFLVLEYAEGGNLRGRLWRHPPDFATALTWAQHLAAGLTALHTPDPALNRPAPIVHRDLKPENLLLRDGVLQITDLGLAKALEEAGVGLGGEEQGDASDRPAGSRVTTNAGTRGYIAPERRLGASSGTPADIYAVGVILSELFAAAMPPPVNARQLAVLIQRCLAEHPEQRPAASEVLDELQTLARSMGRAPSIPVVMERTERARSDFWHNWATTYNNLGQPQQALAAFEEALRLDPRLTAAWHGKGAVLRSLGQPQQALAAFEEALRLDPRYTAAWHGKGNVLRSLGQPQQALAAFEEALRLDPDNVTYLLGTASALDDLKRYAEALPLYRRAAEIEPAEAMHWRNLASALANVEHYDEALRVARHALELQPDHPIGSFRLGTALNGLGRHAEAVEAFARSDQEDAEVWDGKATALRALGREAEALAAEARARELRAGGSGGA